MGQTTEGKGFIQKTWRFADSSAISIVVGSYYTPLGRSIQKPYKSENMTKIENEMRLGGIKKRNIVRGLIKNNSGRTKLPVFKTQSGRTLIGGGGIMPDIYTEADTLSFYMQILLKRSAFIEYAFHLLDNNYLNLSNYVDYHDYCRKYSIDKRLIVGFGKYLESKKMLNNSMFNSNIDDIKLYIKSIIAYIYWGTFAYNYILSTNDVELKEAIKRIEEFEID